MCRILVQSRRTRAQHHSMRSSLLEHGHLSDAGPMAGLESIMEFYKEDVVTR